MTTAFQPTAFQNNAFQIDPDVVVDTKGALIAVDIYKPFDGRHVLVIGRAAVMIMSVENDIPRGILSMVFTKPNGTVVRRVSRRTYIGSNDLVALGRYFWANGYVVYTFEPGELDQKGIWNAYLQSGDHIFPPAQFTVH